MSVRHWLVGLLAIGLCPVAACSGDENNSSSNPAFGDRRSCPGAYTPHSGECWDRTRPTDPTIMADRVETEFRAGLGDRCAPAANSMPGTEGNVTITVTTLPLGRTQYGPRNCGAVWIEDEFEGYVRTLDAWFEERRSSVTMWDLRRCAQDPTLPDAISSATLETHVQHDIKWNGRDWRNNIVPDGKYTLWLQVTENEIVPEGPYIELEWVKGAAPSKTQYPATAGFSVVTIEWRPGPSEPNKRPPDPTAGAPAAGAGGAPAGGMGAPAAGTGAPAAGTGVPAAGTGVPAAGTGVPAAGTAGPVAGIAAPTAGIGASSTGTAAPIAGAAAP